jgi:hypothetical protein
MYQSKDEVTLEYAEQCNAIMDPSDSPAAGCLLLVVISDARRILT